MCGKNGCEPHYCVETNNFQNPDKFKFAIAWT